VLQHNVAVPFQGVSSSVFVDLVQGRHLVAILRSKNAMLGPVHSDSARLELGEMLPDFVLHFLWQLWENGEVSQRLNCGLGLVSASYNGTERS
jgi:hypothetical protein